MEYDGCQQTPSKCSQKTDLHTSYTVEIHDESISMRSMS